MSKRLGKIESKPANQHYSSLPEKENTFTLYNFICHEGKSTQSSFIF